MEALGERGMAVVSLECLKQTHARETAKLVGLTDVMAETLAGIHEKEGHVARIESFEAELDFRDVDDIDFSGVQQPKSDLLLDMPNDAVVATSSKVLYFDQDENGGLNLALQVKFGVKSLKFLLQEMVFNRVLRLTSILCMYNDYEIVIIGSVSYYVKNKLDKVFESGGTDNIESYSTHHKAQTIQ
ncbi:hypothetical protein Tco_0037656 [Tanacetum coccineum]